MFSASAEFYDLIYSTFKDYAGEAAQIGGLLRQLSPRCQTVLDVACGTGEHARLLAGQGFEVDGIDLDPAFVRIAEQKNPAGRFFVAGEANGIRVSRVGRTEIEGRISRLHFDYEIVHPTGTRRASEVHELGLFTTAELLEAFKKAGLHADHDPKGLTDRGLYVAGVRGQRASPRGKLSGGRG